ncbi:MAG: hypothetical protein AVDCRST_MAG66-4176, partial [uncultured Pseudonocardia sp.]
GQGGRGRRPRPAVALLARLGGRRLVAGPVRRRPPRRLHPGEAHQGGPGAPGGGAGGRRRGRREPPLERVERRARHAVPPLRARRAGLGRPVPPPARRPPGDGDRRGVLRPR